MTTPYLGIKARSLDVVLTADAGFVASLVRTEGIWVLGEVVTLVFDSGTSWDATLVDDTASWEKTDTEVNDLITEDPSRVTLWYTSPTGELLRWTRGHVEVQG